MNRLHLFAAVCVLGAMLAGCGGPEDSFAPPTPPLAGDDTSPMQIGPMLVRTAAAAGWVAEPISPGTGEVALVALYGSRMTYLASQAMLDRIVFARGSGSDLDICVCNLDGSGAVRLIDNAAIDQFPVWSPDGNRIAFQRQRTGLDNEIVVMNADGSGAHALTDNAHEDVMPAWSPEGRRIAFQTNRTGNTEVFVMYDDGTAATNLTNNPAGDGMPDWSNFQYDPDIIFVSDRDGNYELYKMEEDGSAQTRLTFLPGNDQFPAFSPVGSAVAWERVVQGSMEIVATSGGSFSSYYNLSSSPGTQAFVAWSSDGRFVCYSDAGGCGDYELVLQQTTPPYDRFVLTDNAPNDLMPDLGSPTLQTDRVIIGPAGSDWGGRNPIWTYADAGIVAYASDGYRNFVRIAVRAEDLPSLSIEPLSQQPALMLGMDDVAGVLVEANEIVSLREDAGRGRQPKLWQLDPLDATAAILYFDLWTGKLVGVLAIADQVYPSHQTATGVAVNQRIEDGALVVEGNFSAVFDGTGARIGDAASVVGITGDRVTVIR